MSIEKEKLRIRHLSDQLYDAAKRLNILSHIGWPVEVKRTFFQSQAQELPKVIYLPFVHDPVSKITDDVLSQLGDSVVDQWLARHAKTIQLSGRMLAACGTDEFFTYSSQVYGQPKDLLKDENTSSLGLALRFNELLAPIDHIDLGAPPPACYLADAVAERMKEATLAMFGPSAPSVEVVDELSANALAGKDRIRIRRTACFTDKDIQQLIEHEAYIHVATLLNGMEHEDVKLLSVVHPGSTKTQEGLAVFAEFISGAIDLDRMSRLSDRVIAIQMSIDGADFIEVYRYFLTKTENKEQAFENARRVFRGGVLTGKAPFTKDIVYLDGLLRVHNFLRSIVTSQRTDCLSYLFAGRLDIEDIPAIAELRKLGMCKPVKYLPPWAKDKRFLLCYLVYSSFLNQVDMKKVSQHYTAMLSDIPKK